MNIIVCVKQVNDPEAPVSSFKIDQTNNTVAIPDLGPKGRDGAGYSSIVISNGAGVKQYVQLLGRGLVGIRASDGKHLWGHNGVANGVVKISDPHRPRQLGLRLDRLPDRLGAPRAPAVRRRRRGSRALLPRREDAAEPPRGPRPRGEPRLRRPRPQQGLPDLRRLHHRQGRLGRRHPQRGQRLGRGDVRRRAAVLPLRERGRRADRGEPGRLRREGLLHDTGGEGPELGPPVDRRRPALRPRAGQSLLLRHPAGEVGLVGEELIPR